MILFVSRTTTVVSRANATAIEYASTVRYEDEFFAWLPRASALTVTCVERLIDWRAYEYARALALAFPCSERISAVSSYWSAVLSWIDSGRRSVLEAPCCSAVWMDWKACMRSCFATSIWVDWLDAGCVNELRSAEAIRRHASAAGNRKRNILIPA